MCSPYLEFKVRLREFLGWVLRLEQAKCRALQLPKLEFGNKKFTKYKFQILTGQLKCFFVYFQIKQGFRKIYIFMCLFIAPVSRHKISTFKSGSYILSLSCMLGHLFGLSHVSKTWYLSNNFGRGGGQKIVY